MLSCKYCGSSNVNVQAVEKIKKRGIIMSCIWLFLSICSFGLLIWIPLLTRKGSKTKSVIVCQDCGKLSKI